MATEILHWSLDSNTSITDDSGNSNTGTITGTLGSVAGQFSNGCSFGSGNYITSPSITLTFPLSVAMWFYESASANRQNLFDWYQSSLGSEFSVMSHNNVLSVYDSSNGEYSSTTSVPASSWHHLAALNDGSTWSIYLDNSLAFTHASSSTISSGMVIIAGANKSGANPWLANLDEIWWFSTSLLTTTEISNLYNYNSLTAGSAYTLTAANGAYSEAGQIVNLNPIRGVKMGYGLKVSL